MQLTLVLSTIEVEYMALLEGAREGIWQKALTAD